MKKRSVIIRLVIIAVLAGLILFRNSKTNRSLPKATKENSSAGTVSSGHTSLSSATNASFPVQTLSAGSSNLGVAPTLIQSNSGPAPSTADATTSEPVKLSADIVLQNVRRAVHQYGEMFGGNPVGTNPEITAALHGGNPKQINFIDESAGMKMDGNGRLIDEWNTPYFFHQISGTDMEIHSAGPDRKMWTGDDLVTH